MGSNLERAMSEECFIFHFASLILLLVVFLVMVVVVVVVVSIAAAYVTYNTKISLTLQSIHPLYLEKNYFHIISTVLL